MKPFTNDVWGFKHSHYGRCGAR